MRKRVFFLILLFQKTSVMDYNQYLTKAMQWAKEAGDVTLRYFRNPELKSVTKQNDFDVLTEADKAAEKVIMDNIRPGISLPLHTFGRERHDYCLRQRMAVGDRPTRRHNQFQAGPAGLLHFHRSATQWRDCSRSGVCPLSRRDVSRGKGFGCISQRPQAALRSKRQTVDYGSSHRHAI